VFLFIHEKFQFAVHLTKAKHANQFESAPHAAQASTVLLRFTFPGYFVTSFV